jgi:hypothetical protein
MLLGAPARRRCRRGRRRRSRLMHAAKLGMLHGVHAGQDTPGDALKKYSPVFLPPSACSFLVPGFAARAKGHTPELLPLLHPSPPPCSAHGFPWESSPAIRKCVRDRQCWTKGTTAVCGKTWGPRGPITYGFPNRCCESGQLAAAGGGSHVQDDHLQVQFVQWCRQ